MPLLAPYPHSLLARTIFIVTPLRVPHPPVAFESNPTVIPCPVAAAIPSDSVWASAVVSLSPTGAAPSSDPAIIAAERLNTHFSFLSAHSSISDLLKNRAHRDPYEFIVRPVSLRHLMVSFQHFRLRDLISILNALGERTGKCPTKDALLFRLYQLRDSPLQATFVFRSNVNARRNPLPKPITAIAAIDRKRKRDFLASADAESARALRERNARAQRKRYERKVLADKVMELTKDLVKNDLFPEICPDTRRAAIIRNFRSLTDPHRFVSHACAVCQEVCYEGQFQVVDPGRVDFTILRDPSIPRPLLPRTYNLDAYDGAILYAAGLQNRDAKGPLNLCTSCSNCLLGNTPKMPEFALANKYWFAREHIPAKVSDALKHASVYDLMLVSRCCTATITHRFTQTGDPSTSQGYSRGNTIVLPQDPSGVRSCLPPSPSEVNESLCAVFVGKTKPTLENIAALHPVLVSKPIVLTLLDFLIAKNRWYRGTTFSQVNLDALFAPGDISAEQAVPCSADIVYLETDEGLRSLGADYTDRYGDVDCVLDPSGSDKRLFMEPVGYTEGDHSRKNYDEMRCVALSRVLRGQPFLKSQSGSAPKSERDPDFLTSVWPHLDPFGLVGFDNPERTHRTSFLRQVQHFLKLDKSPFEQDPSFPFICWNIVQKSEVNKTSAFRVKEAERERVVKEILSLSPDVLDTIAAKWEKDPNALATNAEELMAMRVLRSLRHISTHLKGSAGAKLSQRNEIRSLINRHGTPALFVTLNPADVHHPLVRVLAGHDPATLSLLANGDSMSPYDRALLVAKHPAAAAVFFDAMISGFFRSVVRPDNGPGLFGTCSAYYGTVEAQGKGTLHLHLLLWLDGNLNPQALRDRMTNDPVYKDRMINWIEDNISTGLPDVKEVATDDSLPARQKGTPDPRSLIAPLMADIDTMDSFLPILTDHVKDLVPVCNRHAHSSSCWKHLKKGETRDDNHCRFRRDGKTRALTEIDPETGSILLRQLHPRINNYNKLIMHLMQCNMDIKYVGSGEAAKALVYYVTDYITKATLPVHAGLAAVAYAIRGNTKLFESNPLATQEQRHRNLITKSVNAMMARQEISHQQVMSYLVGGGDHYTDHSFRVLYWGGLDRHIRSLSSTNLDPLPVSLTENDDRDTEDETAVLAPNVVMRLGNRSITASNQILDYTYRPHDPGFSDLCVWDFVSRTEKEQLVESAAIVDPHAPARRGRKPLPRGGFTSPCHPQQDTHRLRLRASPLVPVMLGPTLPRPDRSEEEYERWCRSMLILFKPWRVLADLKDEGQSWKDAFDQALFSPFHRQIMSNMNVQNECKDARNTYSELRKKGEIKEDLMTHMNIVHDGMHNSNEEGDLEQALLEDDGLDDDVGLFDYDDDLLEDNSCGTKPAAVDPDVQTAMDLMTQVAGSTPTSLPQGLPNGCKLFSQVDADAKATIAARGLLMRNLKKEAKFSGRSADDGLHILTEALDPFDANVSVEQLGGATVVHHTVIPDERVLPVDPLSAIDSLVSKYGLNVEQERAFRIIAEHFVSGNSEQLQLYVGGGAGTGKSHVLKAVVELFRICSASESLLVSAPTGIAAVLISGHTIHSLTMLPKTAYQKDFNKLENIWRNVQWLILDEISMVSAKLLSEISHQISLAKGSDSRVGDRPFGGLNIIFSGDHSQLRPVRAKSVFSNELVKDISINTAHTLQGQTNLHGASLWRDVRCHVELTQNWRQRLDPKYSNLVQRVKNGRAWQGLGPRRPDQIGSGDNYASGDYETLLARRLDTLKLQGLDLTRFLNAPFIVARKAVRDPLNLLKTRQFANDTGQAVERFACIDRIGKRPVNEVERERLLRLSSSVTKDALGVLSLVPGMKVMITENVAIGQSVVNGAEGKLVHVEYDLGPNGAKVALCAYVHVPLSRISIDGLPPNVIPILPTTTKFTYNGPRGDSYSISRTQLPMIPAYAYTDYKSQGRSLSEAIVDLNGCTSLQSLYVMLSRVKTLDGLAILRWFKPNKLYQRLPEEFRKEFERLHTLHLDTETWYNGRKRLDYSDLNRQIVAAYSKNLANACKRT